VLTFHLSNAENTIKQLDEQVGTPSYAHLPQTTNQGLVYILKELTAAIKLLRLKVHDLADGG